MRCARRRSARSRGSGCRRTGGTAPVRSPRSAPAGTDGKRSCRRCVTWRRARPPRGATGRWSLGPGGSSSAMSASGVGEGRRHVVGSTEGSQPIRALLRHPCQWRRPNRRRSGRCGARSSTWRPPSRSPPGDPLDESAFTARSPASAVASPALPSVRPVAAKGRVGSTLLRRGNTREVSHARAPGCGRRRRRPGPRGLRLGQQRSGTNAGGVAAAERCVLRQRHAQRVRLDGTGQRHDPVDQGLPGRLLGRDGQLQRRRLRPGHHRLHQRPDLVRRLGLGRSTRTRARSRRPTRAARPASAVNLPMVPGPIAVVYNVAGVDRPDVHPVRARQDLRRQDHQVERPGDRRAQQRREAAGRRRSDRSTARTPRARRTTSPSTSTAAAASDWTFDHDKVWKAPGGQGAKGSDGVSAAVKSTPNTIGYVEYSLRDAEQPAASRRSTTVAAPVELTPDSGRPRPSARPRSPAPVTTSP